MFVTCCFRNKPLVFLSNTSDLISTVHNDPDNNVTVT